MKKLYIKTNTAVVVYIAVFAILILVFLSFGIVRYLNRVSQSPGVDMTSFGEINNTSGQIISIAGSVITIKAMDVSARQPDYASLPPGAALPAPPTKTMEIYIGNDTKILREKTVMMDEDAPPEQVPAEMGAYERIMPGDLKAGDWVNVMAATDIKGLSAFDASEVTLLSSPDAVQSP